MAQKQQMARSEEVARSEEITGSQEVARTEAVVPSDTVAPSEAVVPGEDVVSDEEVVPEEDLVPDEDLFPEEDLVSDGDVDLDEDMIRDEDVVRDGDVVPYGEASESEDIATAGILVTITHSNEKYDINVSPQQGTGEPVVQDVAQLVEEAIGVPVSSQKLIFKGKSLKDMEQPLSALGIQNGCRVMLIGKKDRSAEEVELKKLRILEKAVEKKNIY